MSEERVWPEDDERINTVGQNGNDGLHYEDDSIVVVEKWEDDFEE